MGNSLTSAAFSELAAPLLSDAKPPPSFFRAQKLVITEKGRPGRMTMHFLADGTVCGTADIPVAPWPMAIRGIFSVVAAAAAADGDGKKFIVTPKTVTSMQGGPFDPSTRKEQQFVLIQDPESGTAAKLAFVDAKPTDELQVELLTDDDAAAIAKDPASVMPDLDTIQREEAEKQKSKSVEMAARLEDAKKKAREREEKQQRQRQEKQQQREEAARKEEKDKEDAEAAAAAEREEKEKVASVEPQPATAPAPAPAPAPASAEAH